MAGGMDFVVLRQLAGDVVARLAGHNTHRELGEACERLGLPEPPGEGEGTKRYRVDHSFAALPDADLPMVAERILTSQMPPDAATRNAIQDVLWVGQGSLEIPRRTRHEITRDLDLADLVHNAQLARTRRPKNLIFASRAKPDIRFTDAIDNDIEIAGNADKVLVYDRPIGGDGIRWRDLQAWWMDSQQLADEAEAKKSLYQRLIRSLPGNSPRSGTCTGSTTTSTAARCRISRHSCRRYGCTGTLRQSATAAPKPC
jgi:hypothetical protein